ncbi:tetratricopeptide repeat protein 1 [Anoplophora glabripennis]|uniref:tetratricopeptide repeat protein 1 n=1 Tax=Anoplophora glabripennis TaxID=217634 RepID=UPI000874ED0D|nr:tetratricopeptide repeat protein 1 [Anoplophora glabripennis]
MQLLKMSQESSSEKLPHETVISDLTKDLQSQLTVGSTSDDHKHESTQSSSAELGENEKNFNVPEDFEREEQAEQGFDDYVDEVQLKDLEAGLEEQELELRYKEALELKAAGNDEFKNTKYMESITTYTKALRLCPLKYNNDRSILYANRAASKAKLDRKKTAIDDCSQAIELNDKYVKAYLRRAKLYEETEKLDESLEDYRKILTFDVSNAEALKAVYRLPPLIEERNEKLKTEMLGKLKDLGNMILKPFGLSTENFQLNQDPNSGGYSINFAQNSK